MSMTPVDIRRRLATFMEVEPTAPGFDHAASGYLEQRDALLERFPKLDRMYAAAEALGKPEEALAHFEGALWEVYWVERFIADAASIDDCRRKVRELLSVFANPSATFLWDPNLAAWTVGAALIVERNSRTRGLKGLFKSREVQMLELSSPV
jgi:hypothetical protein